MTPKSKEELKRLDSIRALKKLMTDAGVKVGHREQHIDYLLQEFTSYTQHLYTRQDVKAICEEVISPDDIINGAFADVNEANEYKNQLRAEQRQSIDSIIDKWGK